MMKQLRGAFDRVLGFFSVRDNCRDFRRDRSTSHRSPRHRSPHGRARLGVEQLEVRVQCTVYSAVPLSGPTGMVVGPDNNVYLASHDSNAILRYDGTTGNAVPAPGKDGATFIASGTGASALRGPNHVAFDPNGNLYVTCSSTNNINFYDGTTGAYLGTILGRTSGANGLTFGPDGLLYVDSYNSNQVVRYDPSSGAYLGTFLTTRGPMQGPVDLTFGPDGNLYVLSFDTDQIVRYSGTTGKYLGVFGSNMVGSPHGLAFGPDGLLYAGNGDSNLIVRYNAQAGKYLGVAARGGVSGPHGLAFGANGTFFVSNYGTNDVRMGIIATPPATTTLHVFSETATNIYLGQMSIARYEFDGTDYTDPYYSPLRLGIPLSQIDTTYTYDFNRLFQVQRALQGVNRQVVLHTLFDEITAGATTRTQMHLDVLAFLQEMSIHSGYLQPMYLDGTIVMDPLILLELGEMRCGHVARLAVDLFQAAGMGFTGRLVQLGGHVVAEIGYDSTWHYLDADVFGGGQCVLLPNGTIPSVAQLSQMPRAMDALAAYQEPNFMNSAPLGGSVYPSYFYFSLGAYGKSRPGYLYRNGSSADWAASGYYGWDNYQIVFATDIRLMYSAPVYTPGVPVLTNAVLTPFADGTIQATISWNRSNDSDGDLLGYHVYIADVSRGWNYNGAGVPANLYVAAQDSTFGWSPSMYGALFTLPPSDVALLTTSTTSITYALPAGGTYYVTVMPYDAYGQSVGKTLYHVSAEICINT
jgi:streptogramin lyase